jgi:predicted alpha/beta-fold hydrolase
VVHGLEGSSDSRYVLGTAEKAWVAGFNVLRVNQRNCGGTERLTPTLYNSGLSADYCAVAQELAARDALPEIFLAGFSMGGNLVLKAAAELSDENLQAFRGAAVVCPTMHLAACSDAIHQRGNILYERYFVRNMKRRYQRKMELFPQVFARNGMERVRSIREFDDAITAPLSGYGNAVNYYDRASAMHALERIRVPTLVITAQDDPMVPFDSVRQPALLANSNITLLTPEHGGHCAFIARYTGDERFWAESRIGEFCAANSKLPLTGPDIPPHLNNFRVITQW